MAKTARSWKSFRKPHLMHLNHCTTPPVQPPTCKSDTGYTRLTRSAALLISQKTMPKQISPPPPTHPSQAAIVWWPVEGIPHDCVRKEPAGITYYMSIGMRYCMLASHINFLDNMTTYSKCTCYLACWGNIRKLLVLASLSIHKCIISCKW